MKFTEVVQRIGTALLWVWDHTLGWVLSVVLIGVVRLYQLAISPMLPPSCRFHPSCSTYALGSVRAHGSAKGLALASVRLLRCNPWNKGGVDPVPEKGRWLPGVYPDGRPRNGPNGEHVHS